MKVILGKAELEEIKAILTVVKDVEQLVISEDTQKEERGC